MKKFKIIIIAAVITLSGYSFNSYCQNVQGKADDMGRIALKAWVPQQIENMPGSARKMLANKLTQVVTKNGMAGSGWNQRFIITANITVLTKNLTTTAPPMTALSLGITFYIGDGFEGNIFASEYAEVKGVGTNETKAYMQALKGIKPTSPAMISFVDKGKAKIIEYFNSKCDFIIKEAQTLASQNEFEAAIYKLVSVPEVCSECYNKCMDAVAPIYQKQIDRECKMKLQEAQGIWNAAQDMVAAEQAGAILATIEPEASCFSQVKELSNKIAVRVKQIDDREWKYILKEQAQESERIRAIRDIGVAYGNGQPQNVTYKSFW